MDFLTGKRRKVFFLCVCCNILSWTAPVLSGTESTAKAIERYLGKLESELVDVTSRPEMFVRKITLADQPITKVMSKHPELYSILRINSRGLVVNELLTEGRPGAKLRDLSTQKWFEQMREMTPYYGSVTTTIGRIYLFWCIPILNKSQPGSPSSSGALLVRIDLRKALEAAARENKEPFILFQEKSRIFSHEWKDEFQTSSPYPLTIKGFDSLFVFVRAEAEMKKTAGSAVTASMNQPAAKQTQAVAAQPEATKKKKSSLPLVLALIFTGLILAVAAYWLMIFNRKRHAQMMAAIDKEHQPFEYGETVVMDRSKLMQYTAQEAAAQQQNSPGQQQGGARSLPQRDPLKETRIMSLDQMKAEVEADINQKLNTVLAERTKQIRKEAFAEARLGYLQNMKNCSVAIGRQIKEIETFIQDGGARGRVEAEQLQQIINELQSIRNSIEREP